MSCKGKEPTKNPYTGEITPSDRNFGSPLSPIHTRGLPRYNELRPVPPDNLKVVFNQKFGSFNLYWDNPNVNPKNSRFDIVGVNLYRSIDSSQGPFTKINSSPIVVNFFQDISQYIEVENEVVDFQDINISPEVLVIKAKNFPFVDSSENAYLDDPNQILVRVDGKETTPKSIDPLTGEIRLFKRQEWDPIMGRYIKPLIPTETSLVEISYKYTTLLLQGNYKFDQRIFYKLTSVDAEGNETFLEDSEVQSYQDADHLNYLCNNMINKNSFILEQSGERGWVYIQKSTGELCPEHNEIQNDLYDTTTGQRDCTTCFGTGFVGGFIGPLEVRLAPFDNERSYKHSNSGRIVSSQQETFLMNFPVMRQGDLVVRQNGERYVIGPVKRKEMAGVLLQQNFTLFVLQPTDILYKITLGKPHASDHKDERLDKIEEDKRHLYGKGKTPKFRNIHGIKEDPNDK